MKLQLQIALIAVVTILAGCATSYQKQSFSGGFDETQLDKNVFRVTFKGNGYTSADRAADLCLLRSADLTLSNGYHYFAIVESKEGTSQSAVRTPTQSYTNTNITGTTYGGGFNATGSSTTTTYGGQTFLIRKPSASNTIIMLNDRAEVQGMTYDAQFLYDSLSKKYGVESK